MVPIKIFLGFLTVYLIEVLDVPDHDSDNVITL